MAQQTAVEWLEKTIQSMIEHGADLGEDYPALMVHIAQAKEMEKQQIMNAFDIRKVDIAFDKKTTSEQYYTETYGK